MSVGMPCPSKRVWRISNSLHVGTFRERFRVAQAGGRFRVVFGKFQRIGQQEGVQARGSARRAEAHVDARQAFFFLAQMQLSKNVLVVEGSHYDAFAEPG